MKHTLFKFEGGALSYDGEVLGTGVVERGGYRVTAPAGKPLGWFSSWHKAVVALQKIARTAGQLSISR